MKQFEYKFINHPLFDAYSINKSENLLMQLGSEGWEIIHMQPVPYEDPNRLYTILKREMNIHN